MQQEGVCNPAVLIVILAREFAVSGLRMLAAGSEEKIVIPANIWGKLKTAGMMVTICAFYFGCALWPENAFLRSAANILCWLCAAVTLFSGITYCFGALYSQDHVNDLGVVIGNGASNHSNQEKNCKNYAKYKP